MSMTGREHVNLWEMPGYVVLNIICFGSSMRHLIDDLRLEKAFRFRLSRSVGGRRRTSILRSSDGKRVLSRTGVYPVQAVSKEEILLPGCTQWQSNVQRASKESF